MEAKSFARSFHHQNMTQGFDETSALAPLQKVTRLQPTCERHVKAECEL